MPIRLLSSILLVVVLSLPSPVTAATWYINPQGTGDAPTIQAAEILAAPGDSIVLTSGTYTGPGNREILVSKSIFIVSETRNPAQCKIDCQYQGRAFVINSFDPIVLTLDGITIASAVSQLAAPYESGGAIYSLEGSGVVMNCRFQNCSPTAVTDYLGGQWMFDRCVFQGNDGGAAFRWSFGVSFAGCAFLGNGYGVRLSETGEGSISNCQFYGNTNDALMLFDTSLSGVTGCTFIQNWGTALIMTQDAVPFTDCRFEDNAGNLGGAVLADQSYSVFERCVFSGNSALDKGGAIYASLSPLTLTHCVFAGNSATNGGCMAASAESNLTVESCTLYGNWSSPGAVIALSSDSIAQFTRTIVAASIQGTTISCDATSSATFTCSDVFGNAGGNWTGCIAGQNGLNGNLSLDPLFCNAGAGNFYLTAPSPCLDTPCGTMGAFDAGGCTTAVRDRSIPGGFVLHQNVPNPFNPITVIPVDAPDGGGVVAIALYDVAGRRMRMLFEGRLDEGRHLLRWDARDDSGAAVASGIYFVRLESAGTVQTVKLVLLK